MSPQRIIRVANVLEEGRVGGPQRRVAVVGEQLRALGVQTTVFAPAGSEDFARDLDARGVDHELLPMHRLGRESGQITAFLASFGPEVAQLASRFRAGRFDLVHVSGGAWQPKGVVAARLCGLPSLWHLNDTRTPLPVRVAFSALAWPLPTGFIVSGARVADYYLPPWLRRGRPVSLLRPPVDGDRFDPARARPLASLPAGDGPLVVTVTNVNPDKGLDCLVEAIGRANASVPEARYVVIGSVFDSQRDYHRALLERADALGIRNLHFHGPCDDIPGVLAAATLYVCSSRAESGPMSVWEAGAMDLPIVSTDVGDVQLVLGDLGRVVPVGDALAMADAIVATLRDPPAAGSMRERVLSQVSLPRVAEAHREAYRSVL